MSPLDEERLLKMTAENNYMLKMLTGHINNDNSIDFVNNIIANLMANRIEMGRR